MRLKLIIQFSIVTTFVLMLTMGIFSFFNIKVLQRTLREQFGHELSNLSQTLIRSTRHEMLTDNRRRVYDMMREVATHKDISAIRFLNHRGKVVFSTIKDEEGRYVDPLWEPSCNGCHRESGVIMEAQDEKRLRVATLGAESVLNLATPILNEPSCSEASCHVHPPQIKVLGVLELGLSLRNLNTNIKDYKLSFLVEVLFLTASILVCLTILTRRLIDQPVRKLLEHTRAVAQGDWRYIDSPSNDELGELALAFNDMTKHLEKARRDRDEWAATLESRVEERTQEIREMQAELIRSEKLASLGELVAGIAHELNNPLTGITMYSSIVAEDPRLDPELKKDFSTIMRQAERCARIVRELLNFARDSTPVKTMNSVNDTIERTLALVENHALFHNVEIIKNYDPRVPEILMDPGQMEQVFFNMLVNASQAMPDGGKVVLTTGVRSAGRGLGKSQSVFVRIEDTGQGIPPEALSRIFDPFFTTKGTKGTGLGLAVSFRIIENHRGSIEVETEVGKGTAFTITLPIVLPHEEPEAFTHLVP